MALGALITAMCVLFGMDELTVEKLVATVSALGVLAAYILTEGYLDGKSMSDGDMSEETDDGKNE